MKLLIAVLFLFSATALADTNVTEQRDNARAAQALLLQQLAVQIATQCQNGTLLDKTMCAQVGVTLSQ